MRKRAAALVLALALSAGVLSGCRTTEPGPPEPTVPASATAPEEVSTFSETAAIPTEDLSQDPRLLEFDQRLTVLGAVSPEEFCANHEEALALYQAGLRPESTMAAYDPLSDEAVPGDFYYASLDPDTYGVAQFFALPAGERSLTAEEYLELVEAAGQMPAADLALPGNSWFSAQESREDACIPYASRRLYGDEEGWLPYLLGMYYQGQELPAEGRTLAPLYLPLPSAEAVYTLYPTDPMTPNGLLADGLYALSRLPEARQDRYRLPEGTDFEAIQSAAVQALRNHMGLTEDPVAVYCACPDVSSPPFDSPDFVWDVGLLYPRGASYLVGLKPQDLSLAFITPLEDRALDWDRPWEGPDATR